MFYEWNGITLLYDFAKTSNCHNCCLDVINYLVQFRVNVVFHFIGSKEKIGSHSVISCKKPLRTRESHQQNKRLKFPEFTLSLLGLRIKLVSCSLPKRNVRLRWNSRVSILNDKEKRGEANILFFLAVFLIDDLIFRTFALLYENINF